MNLKVATYIALIALANASDSLFHDLVEEGY